MAKEEKLSLPGREVNLADVKGMSDDEYENLVAYARQWDSPNQREWLDQIGEARGEELADSEAAPNPTGYITMAGEGVSEEVPEGTVDDVLEWVGDDKARAVAALEAENVKDKPRSTLVEELEVVAQQ